MTQSYINEARDDIIGVLESLQNIVGYHFVWCPAYLSKEPVECTCGMRLMMAAKTRLKGERSEEYNLWADALEGGD